MIEEKEWTDIGVALAEHLGASRAWELYKRLREMEEALKRLREIGASR